MVVNKPSNDEVIKTSETPSDDLQLFSTGIPKFKTLKNVSDEQLLKGIKPSMITWQVNFNQKTEQDQAINKLIEYLKKSDTRTFPASVAEDTGVAYRLGHKFVSGIDLGARGYTEGDTDPEKPIEDYIKKVDNTTYTCTGMLIYLIIGMHEKMGGK